jgi:hypothetical protein
VLAREDVVTVPGAVYSAVLYLVEVLGHNAEPCSVTHLANTADMGTW